MTLKTWFGILFIGFIFILGLFAPFIGIDPLKMDYQLMGTPQPPSWAHLLGTDELGRDIFIRCIYGGRISLLVGFVAVSISILIGVIVGVTSGYLGGVVDEIIMRIIDMLMAIPTLFLILIIQVLLEPNIINVMVVIGVSSWMGVARIVRAEVLSLKQREFILSARSRGILELKILFKHLLPHSLNPVIVAAMLGMGGAILTESVLSFLGLGVQPPHASWGNMLENSLGYLRDAPWMALIPGVLITLTVLSLNFLGDGLWLLLDPKAKDNNVKN